MTCKQCFLILDVTLPISVVWYLKGHCYLTESLAHSFSQLLSTGCSLFLLVVAVPAMSPMLPAWASPVAPFTSLGNVEIYHALNTGKHALFISGKGTFWSCRWLLDVILTCQMTGIEYSASNAKVLLTLLFSIWRGSSPPVIQGSTPKTYI